MRLQEDIDAKQVQENMGQYDKLLRTRSLLLTGEINKEMADKLIKDLEALYKLSRRRCGFGFCNL